MTAQLLLLEDVDNLGRSGDIVKVKPGFARNYLIPKGVALFADKQAIRMQEKLQEERRKQAEEDRKESEALAQKLHELTVNAIVKVDNEGNMYGSVAIADIITSLHEQHGIELEKKAFTFKAPIKKIGEHTIRLKLKEDVEAVFKLNISPEEI